MTCLVLHSICIHTYKLSCPFLQLQVDHERDTVRNLEAILNTSRDGELKAQKEAQVSCDAAIYRITGFSFLFSVLQFAC